MSLTIRIQTPVNLNHYLYLSRSPIKIFIFSALRFRESSLPPPLDEFIYLIKSEATVDDVTDAFVGCDLQVVERLSIKIAAEAAQTFKVSPDRLKRQRNSPIFDVNSKESTARKMNLF